MMGGERERRRRTDISGEDNVCFDPWVRRRRQSEGAATEGAATEGVAAEGAAARRGRQGGRRGIEGVTDNFWN